MKKLRFLIILTLLLLPLQGQYITPIIVGFTPVTPSNGNAVATLNSAATWAAFGFRITSNLTLDEIRVFISAVTGTVTTGFTCDIYSDSGAGAPGSSIAGPFTVSTSLAGGSNSYDFTGINTALTAGTQYWAVFKNTTGTPASNNMTLRFGGINTGQQALTVSNKIGWVKVQSADSGSTWTAASVANMVGPRLKFTDGSYGGLSVTSAGASTGSTTAVYSTREAGVLFTVPAGPTLNVAGVSMYINATGTPTGTPRFRIYTGSGASPSLTGTTFSSINPAAIGWLSLYFSTPLALAPGVYRVVLSETTQSDTSSNRYDTYLYTVDNTAASKALMPFGSQFTYSTDGGSTFAETDTLFLPFSLILSSTPFTVSGGGGGTRVYAH